jgi:hypothetical protein
MDFTHVHEFGFWITFTLAYETIEEKINIRLSGYRTWVNPQPPASENGRTETCSTEKSKSRRERAGGLEPLLLQDPAVDPNKTTAKKSLPPRLLFSLAVTVHAPLPQS